MSLKAWLSLVRKEDRPREHKINDFKMIFVLCSTFLLFKLSTSHKLDMDSLFHIETQHRFCGCEEEQSLDLLKKMQPWTPELFMTHRGKMWLGAIRAQDVNSCSKMCTIVNQRTTHFVFEPDAGIFQTTV